MAFDVEAAKADGYTDEEIQQYLATKDQPLPADQPRDRSEEEEAVYKGMGLKAAEIGAEAYGAKKLLIDPALKMIRGPVAPTPGTPPGATQRIMSQAFGNPTAVSVPTTPNPAVSPSYTAPAPQPAAPQQPGAIRQGLQQGMEYANKVRQIAMDKVIQNAGTIGKAGIGAAAALTPGNIGQNYNFPTSGPMRGMEINPQTGRPWTPQELSALGQ